MANLYKVYEKALIYALSHKKKVFGMAVILLIISILTVPFVGFELMPATDSGQISVSIELPKDAKLEETII
jgi:HAE1 family hydrophobic/amphiphilic exporter-1